MMMIFRKNVIFFKVATQRHVEVLEPTGLNCYISLFNFASKKAIIIDQIVLEIFLLPLSKKEKV